MLELFSQAWADAAAAAINAGPTEKERAAKIDRYWEWIEKAKTKLDCTWALGVDDGPGGGRAVLFQLKQGRCVEASAVTLAEARERADYLMVGSPADWHDLLLEGYHTGKAVMYRKLVLAKGEVLLFFRSAFYWTEALAHMQRVPTHV